MLSHVASARGCQGGHHAKNLGESQFSQRKESIVVR